MGGNGSLHSVMGALQHYNVRVKSVRFMQKGYWVRTEKGDGWLQPWNQRLLLERFLVLQKHLDKKKSELRVPLLFSRNYRPFVFWEKQYYTFSASSGKLCGPPRGREEYTAWGRMLATFHKQTQDLPLLKNAPSVEWRQRFQEAEEELARFAQVLWQKNPRDAEEILYLRNVAVVQHRLRISLDLLKEVPAMPPSHWILGGALFQAFVKTAEGKMQLAPWQSLSMGSTLLDVGLFCRKSLTRHSFKEDLSRFLEGYEQVLPLSTAQLQVLLAYLIFPHDIWTWVIAKQSGKPNKTKRVGDLHTLLKQQRQHRSFYSHIAQEIDRRRRRMN